MRFLALCLSALAICLPLRAALAQEPLLRVDGDVVAAQTFAAADLAAAPRELVEIADKDGRRQSYAGVDAVWLLRKAGAPVREDMKSTDAARFVHAQGRDGYVAVFAIGEFDKGRFLVVDRIDGQPLFARSGPLTLVAVSDDRRTRWVKQLFLLQVRASRP